MTDWAPTDWGSLRREEAYWVRREVVKRMSSRSEDERVGFRRVRVASCSGEARGLVMCCDMAGETRCQTRPGGGIIPAVPVYY